MSLIEVRRVTNVDERSGKTIETIVDSRGARYRWAQRYEGDDYWVLCRGATLSMSHGTAQTEAAAVLWVEGGVH